MSFLLRWIQKIAMKLLLLSPPPQENMLILSSTLDVCDDSTFIDPLEWSLHYVFVSIFRGGRCSAGACSIHPVRSVVLIVPNPLNVWRGIMFWQLSFQPSCYGQCNQLRYRLGGQSSEQWSGPTMRFAYHRAHTGQSWTPIDMRAPQKFYDTQKLSVRASKKYRWLDITVAVRAGSPGPRPRVFLYHYVLQRSLWYQFSEPLEEALHDLDMFESFDREKFFTKGYIHLPKCTASKQPSIQIWLCLMDYQSLRRYRLKYRGSEAWLNC